MKDINDFIKHISKYEKKSKDELLEIYNLSLAYLFSKNNKTISSLSEEQAKITVNWLERYVRPLYEEFEEYEKCQKIKETVELIRELKNFEK